MTTKRAPAKCRKCGKPRKGHPLTRCEPSSAKATGGGTRSKPARKAARVAAELPTNGAWQTALVLLGQLEHLQAKLTARIAAVKELSEIL